MATQDKTFANNHPKEMRYVRSRWAVISTLLFLALVAPLLAIADDEVSQGAAQATNLDVTAGADTYVASGRPSQASKPDLRIFWVGHNETDNFGVERGLLRFDISTQQLPVGSTIDSAALLLTLSGTTTNDGPMNVTALRILTDQWPENISWQQQETLPVTSANAATIEVGRTFRQYQWDLRNLIQVWANEPARMGLSLRLDSDKTNGTHERNFWSRECPLNLCSVEQRPRLVIQYSLPPTPAPTFTPTATPTPEPGISVFRLASEPRGAIAPLQELTYTIYYKNGPFALNQVEISDQVPDNVLFVTDSITSDRTAMTGTYDMLAHKVVFTLTGELVAAADGLVSYRVQRPADADWESQSAAATGSAAAWNSADEFVVVNDGAEMSWLDQGAPNKIRSNSTRNPGSYTYLPVVSRRP